MKNVYKFIFLSLIGFAVSAKANPCTFEQGFDLGLARDPFKDFCTPETEPIFLKGYAVGRKMSWVESDLQRQNNLINCLTEELERKFNGTMSPVHLDPSLKKLNASLSETEPCPVEFLRTPGEFELKIDEAAKLRKNLTAKRLRLQKLRDRAIINSSQVDNLIKEYEQSGPVDELDVKLRWKPYVAGKGGIQNLDSSTRALLVPEIPGQSSLSVDLVQGCAIGFGMGHYKQNRFKSDGWVYALVDSTILLSLLYGISNKESAPAMVGVLGIPVSRVFQLVDVQEYDSNNRINIENLKSHLKPEIRMISFKWDW